MMMMMLMTVTTLKTSKQPIPSSGECIQGLKSKKYSLPEADSILGKMELKVL
jgi:hypothetical protein